MILCCGESLIDMLPRALETGENAFLPVAGGAVFNTAIALGRLGLNTGFLRHFQRHVRRVAGGDARPLQCRPYR